MAGNRMTSTEIWLRLIHTGSLCGDQMLAAAARLLMQTRIDDAVVRDAGLSTKQAQQFFALDENELQRNLAWLEQPENHLLTADDPRYPLYFARSLTTPAHCLLKAILKPLLPFNWRLWVAARHRYGERWGKSCANNFHKVVSRSPVGWPAVLTALLITPRCL